MKTVMHLVGASLLAFTLTALSVNGATPSEKQSPQRPPPGVEAAQAVSTLTGVAISPLLGVGAVGAWTYYRSEPVHRSNLPWFAQPWFWLPALILVTLVFIKDAAGTALPTALKKPLDVLELFENKVSGLIAAGAFVPLIATLVPAIHESASLPHHGLAFIDPVGVLNLLLLPLAIAAFILVFLAGHAINVLILVSPFGLLDAALKSFRTFLMTTVLAASMANPYLGALWSVVLIIIAYFIAGWTFRLSVFGTVFAWDLMTLKHRRAPSRTEGILAFAARKIGSTPIRTCGRLFRDEAGRLILQYRPWLVLPARRVALPDGDYFVGRGLLYPEIHCAKDNSSEAWITLPPRFRTHELELARSYGLREPRDVGLRRGLKALWAWMKRTLGPQVQAAPAT